MCAACVSPKRVALKSPSPLTYGGTDDPGQWRRRGRGYGSGLAGQELDRASILNLNLGTACSIAISVSAAATAATRAVTRPGCLWRAKVRLGEGSGPAAASACTWCCDH